VKEEQIDPYFCSPNASRGKPTYAPVTHLADAPQMTSLEVLGNPNFYGVPMHSWILTYEYSGQALCIEKMNSEFRELFSDTGKLRHEPSQDFYYYLHIKGSGHLFDSMVWHSLSGRAVGIKGFIYAFQSGQNCSFQFKEKHLVTSTGILNSI
jgi:hypothetical protein